MTELKPCPFCGRTPTVDDCGEHRYFVRCKCGIVQDKLYMQKCDAVRRWNTRKIDKDTNVPSTDYISRQEAIDAVENCEHGEELFVIKSLPSAQPTQTNTLETLDCISRKAVLELIERMKPYHQDADDIAEMIANMPFAQPVQDCISRQAAIDALGNAGLINYAATGSSNGLIHAMNVIKGLPAAQPQRMRGRWIEYPEVLTIADALDDTYIGCSCCKNVFNILDNDTERFLFCPNCGADMRGGNT